MNLIYKNGQLHNINTHHGQIHQYQPIQNVEEKLLIHLNAEETYKFFLKQ